MARIYLDEDISRDTKRILDRQGHDVIHALDVGHISVPDPEHLKYAAETGRVLVTFNRRDFREAHQIWVALNIWTNLNSDHAGILTPWGQIANVQWANLVHESNVGVAETTAAVVKVWMVSAFGFSQERADFAA